MHIQVDIWKQQQQYEYVDKTTTVEVDGERKLRTVIYLQLAICAVARWAMALSLLTRTQ